MVTFSDKDEIFESEKVSQIVADGETSGATVEKEQTPPVVTATPVEKKSIPNGKYLCTRIIVAVNKHMKIHPTKSHVFHLLFSPFFSTR